MLYLFLCKFANWFAVKFRQETTIFDRLASWFEPTPKDESDIDFDLNRRYKDIHKVVRLNNDKPSNVV